MYEYSLLVGNGINNLTEGYSWDDVLRSLSKEYAININTLGKPFPLAYEEIYFKILKRDGNKNTESDIKDFISEKIRAIIPNDIHRAMVGLNCKNIMTTNYDLAFENAIIEHLGPKAFNNEGKIKEQRYNVFRHHILDNKKIWHIHGDINVPNSITLGYEHYSGHLQSMRNYTTTGSHYKKKKGFDQKPLTSRLKTLTEEHSWIDSFFLRNDFKGDLIEAVIGLPPSLFFNTGISAAILLINKEKPVALKNKVIFIDASSDYGDGKNMNHLRDYDITRIVSEFNKAKQAVIDAGEQTEESLIELLKTVEKEKYLRVVNISEIAENNYNLNISRYIDKSVTEDILDIKGLLSNLEEIDLTLQHVDEKLANYLTLLAIKDPN